MTPADKAIAETNNKKLRELSMALEAAGLRITELEEQHRQDLALIARLTPSTKLSKDRAKSANKARGSLEGIGDVAGGSGRQDES